MKPVYEAAAALGLTTSFLPARYGGGGASIVDTLIATEELAAVDGGFPTILLVNGLALMPLAWYGTEEQCAQWICRAADPREPGFPRRMGGQRAGRNGELRPPEPDGGHPALRPAGPGRRHARAEWREALAVQRRRLGPRRGRRQPVHRADRPHEGRPGIVERGTRRARHARNRLRGHRQGRPPNLPERHDDVPGRPGAR